MADYYPVIKAAVEYLRGETAEKRAALHQRARSMLREELTNLGVAEDVIENELLALESAIKKVCEERLPLRPGWVRFWVASERIRRNEADAQLTPLKLTIQFSQQDKLPAITLPAMLEVGDRTREGDLILAVRIPWHQILEIFRKNPHAIYEIDSRKWEEIIAGAYKEAGFDQVELTPRSGDKGRDVVATKVGLGSIRHLHVCAKSSGR